MVGLVIIYSPGLTGFSHFCSYLVHSIPVPGASSVGGNHAGQLKGCKPEHHASQPHGLRVRESIDAKGRVGVAHKSSGKWPRKQTFLRES